MELGPKEAKLKMERLQIKNVLSEAGWLSALPMLPTQAVPKPVVPAKSLSGPQWKAILQQEKQSILEKRLARVFLNPAEASDVNHTYIQNKEFVKIVDKSYLQKKSYISQFEKSISSVSKKYCLNAEQERAFNVIAHHAVFSISHQLLMYVGRNRENSGH
jgi:hypothetical protein